MSWVFYCFLPSYFFQQSLLLNSELPRGLNWKRVGRFEDLLSPAFILELESQVCAPVVGAGDLDSGPPECTASALSISPSLMLPHLEVPEHFLSVAPTH